MYREKIYSCNLIRFKGKVNTLMGVKRKVRSLVPIIIKKTLKFLLMDVG